MPRTVARLAATAATAFLGVIASTGVAWAHAEVVATYPSTTATPEELTHVSVTFDEPVDLIPRALALTTDLGVPVATDAPRLLGGRELRANLQDVVVSGRYAVAWRVRSDDGHIETGTFRFQLAGGSAAGAPGAPAGRGARPAAAPAPTPAPGEPIWPVIVAAGLAVAAGLGAAVVVRRGLRALAGPEALYPADPVTGASRVDHTASQE